MFVDRLIENIEKTNNPSVVGLDTNFDYLPEELKENFLCKFGNTFKAASEGIFEFNKTLIDSFYELIPCVKVQVAYYEMYGFEGMRAFERTCNYAKSKGLLVIADCKRNDIGSTATAYSKAYIGTTQINGECIKAFSSDCVTVNAYLGIDGIQPFLNDVKKEENGIFVLVKTSNPSSGEFQDKIFKNENVTLYESMARKVATWGETSIGKYGYSNVGAVVGATYPEIAQKTRGVLSKNYLLVPGYGAQGATGSFMKNFFNKDGRGAIVNSSRGILCAYKKMETKDYADAAVKAVKMMQKDIIENINS